MNRRLFVGLAALALAALLALAIVTQADEGPPAGEAGSSAVLVPAGPAADAAAGLTGGPQVSLPTQAPLVPDAPSAPEALAGTASLRVHVDCDAQRASPVGIALLASDGNQHAYVTITGSEHAWTDLWPGRWELQLTGTGWELSETVVQLAAGQPAEVQVRPRNRIAGQLITVPSGRPVPLATLAFECASVPDALDGERNVFTPPEVQVLAPDGRFDLAGINLALGGLPWESVVVRARAAGLLEAESERLHFQPSPFWSGVIVGFPDPVLIGRVQAADADHGAVPVAEAEVCLVTAETTLDDVSLYGDWVMVNEGRRSLARTLSTTITDELGAFAFGPNATAPVVSQVRLLAYHAGYRILLSPPFELDQKAPASAHELLLLRGGRIHGRILVPRSAPGGAPLAEPRQVQLLALDDTGAIRGNSRDLEAWPLDDTSPPDQSVHEFDVEGLEPGRYRVAARLQLAATADRPDGGTAVLMQNVVVEAGARTDVELHHGAGSGTGILRGEVRLPEGRELELGQVALVQPADISSPLAGTTLQPDGHFVFEGLAPGEAQLVVMTRFADGLAFTTAPVRIVPGENPVARLRLDVPEVRLAIAAIHHGRRLLLGGSTGDPVFDGFLAQGRLALDAPSTGMASIFGLLPGTYQLSAEGPAPLEVPFELPPGRAVVHVDID